MTTAQPSTQKVSLFHRPIVHLLAIACLVFLIYSNTFNAPFQFDDDPNIVDNPAIKDFHYFADPSSVARIDNLSKPLKPLFKTRYIGYLTFALNYRLHGLDVMGYHLVNIFIHIFNSLLLYWLITLTFRTPFFSVAGSPMTFPDGSRNLIALFTALFFAVHPIQTQAVTYIVQRFASLATLFYMLSLVMYIKWRELKEQQTKRYMPGIILYAVSLLSAVLAMKTKEFAFTLPIVMAIYELMFFDGKIMKKTRYLIPFFLAVLVIPTALADNGGSIAVLSGVNKEDLNIYGERSSMSGGDYLFTQFRVIVTYIRLLFLPINQNIDYDYPIYSSFFDPAVVLSFLSLLSVIIAGIYLYRLSKRPERRDRCWLRLISFGIFWFFITLSPESGVIPIMDLIFEHRVYLPSVGFFMALTAAIGAGLARCENRGIYAKKVIVFVMLLVVIILSGATYTRNTVWQDNMSLWEDAAEKSPNKARPLHNIGLEYAKQRRTDEAIKAYQAALRLKPDYVACHYDLGVAYIDKGRVDDAIREFQTILKIIPDDYLMTRKFLEFLQKK
ncbi:MAG: tetratricopeptide repeat protein [Nitrospirae bacterium]|nr:tetratricopeptide repeat protein [Nitrospirota bacterium]